MVVVVMVMVTDKRREGGREGKSAHRSGKDKEKSHAGVAQLVFPTHLMWLTTLPSFVSSWSPHSSQRHKHHLQQHQQLSSAAIRYRLKLKLKNSKELNINNNNNNRTVAAVN